MATGVSHKKQEQAEILPRTYFASLVLVTGLCLSRFVFHAHSPQDRDRRFKIDPTVTYRHSQPHLIRELVLVIFTSFGPAAGLEASTKAACMLRSRAVPRLLHRQRTLRISLPSSAYWGHK